MKNIHTNLNADVIIKTKIAEFSYRIQHLLNQSIKNFTPHFIGQDGPYIDNTCCEVNIQEFVTVLDFFISENNEIQKHISSINELSKILSITNRLNNTLCIMSDLDSGKDSSIDTYLFSEKGSLSSLGKIQQKIQNELDFVLFYFSKTQIHTFLFFLQLYIYQYRFY